MVTRRSGPTRKPVTKRVSLGPLDAADRLRTVKTAPLKKDDVEKIVFGVDDPLEPFGICDVGDERWRGCGRHSRRRRDGHRWCCRSNGILMPYVVRGLRDIRRDPRPTRARRSVERSVRPHPVASPEGAANTRAARPAHRMSDGRVREPNGSSSPTRLPATVFGVPDRSIPVTKPPKCWRGWNEARAADRRPSRICTVARPAATRPVRSSSDSIDTSSETRIGSRISARRVTSAIRLRAFKLANQHADEGTERRAASREFWFAAAAGNRRL